MAVQQAIFTTDDFDYQAACDKQLCAVVDGSNNIVGTGIVTTTAQGVIITVDGVRYNFNSNGLPADLKTSGYTLKMAESHMANIEKGTVGKTDVAFTRDIDAETGDIVYTPITPIEETTYDVPISALNARDQFALQALHGMMEKIPDPSALGKNEITHYCEAAYLWASYMMTESSKTRAIIKDSESAQATQFDDLGVLDSNTEKLLNNLVIALSRTDTEESGVYSERIVNPKLMTFLNNYVKDGNSTVNLKSVITAINSIATALTTLNSKLDTINATLGTIKTAVEGLQPEESVE